MQQGARRAIRALERIVGRPLLARFARLLTNEVRLDVANDMAENGETIVQRIALRDSTPVVLDVGCHFGEWSLSLLRQPGHKPVLHGFEPSKSSYPKAQCALAGKGQVHRLALSDHVGTAELVIVHEGAGSNSLVPFTNGEASASTETVPVSTLDSFCEGHGLNNVTLLKIDAEGHDLAVIRGARGMLAQRSISLVQFEYNWRWIEARSFLLDAFEVCQEYGYSIGKVTRRGIEVYEGWHPELETFRQGNYLAFLPDWRDLLPTLEWWGPADGADLRIGSPSQRS